MSLKDTIRRIIKEETDLPPNIRRRLMASEDEIIDMFKEKALGLLSDDKLSVNEIIRGAAQRTAEEFLIYDEYVSHDRLMRYYDILKYSFLEKYYDIIEEYLNNVIGDSDYFEDGYKYIFWKHSEINGGNGFREGFSTWGDFIKDVGWRSPINWWEIKRELDQKDEGRVIFLKPGDKHNTTGYYYSVIKTKNIK